MAIDKDNSGTLTYEEIIQECSKIHCGYVLQKVKNAIEADTTGGAKRVDEVFKTVDNDRSGEIDIIEFNEMLHLLYDKVDKVEVDELFKHFDSRGLGKITIEDFRKALG